MVQIAALKGGSGGKLSDFQLTCLVKKDLFA